MEKSDNDILFDEKVKPPLSKGLFISGSIISILLLVFSFVYENAVLLLLDGLIPTVFILYLYFSKKQLPFYNYLICSCGIYSLLWTFFYFPDFKPESVNRIYDYSLPTIMNAIGEFTAFGIFSVAVIPLLLLIASKIEKYLAINTIKKFIKKVKLSFLAVFIIVAMLIFSTFCSLNVTLDEPYKECYVYVVGTEDRINSTNLPKGFHGIGEVLRYKYSLESEEKYFIEYNHFGYTPKHFDENGNPMVKMQFGKGAFGLEWRRIVE